MRTQPDPGGKFGLWLIELEEPSYEIMPRNGLDHVVPDCMSKSRYSEDNKRIQDDEHFLENRIFAVNPILKNDGLNELRQSKKMINQIKNSKGITNGRFKRFKLMHLDNGILMRGKQVVLPNSLSNYIV